MIQPAFCSGVEFGMRGHFRHFRCSAPSGAMPATGGPENWLEGQGTIRAAARRGCALCASDAAGFPDPQQSIMVGSLSAAIPDRGVADHVSGRESRFASNVGSIYEIELAFDLLRMDGIQRDLQAILGFYDQMRGQDLTFTFPILAELGFGSAFLCRFNDDSEDLEEFMSRVKT